MTTESTKQGLHQWQQQAQGLHGFPLGSLGVLWLLSWSLAELLTGEVDVSLTFLPALETHFLLLGCLSQP